MRLTPKHKKPPVKREKPQTINPTKWGAPMPWDVLDGVLLDLWRELVVTMRVFNDRTNAPLTKSELERVDNDPVAARKVQCIAAAKRFRDMVDEVWHVCGDLNPATLSPAHRQIRAWAQTYIQTVKTPDLRDRDDIFGKLAEKFTQEALLGVTNVRKTLIDGSKKKKLKHRTIIRTAEDEATAAE